MADKHIKLSEETRILLNKVRAQIYKKDPQIKKVTDELCVNMALKKYLDGIKNAK